MYFHLSLIFLFFKKNANIAQKISTTMQVITGLVSVHFPPGQGFQILSNTVSMNIQKFQASAMPSVMNVSNAVVRLPSFCALMGITPSSVSTTSSMYVNINAVNCTNEIITLKVNYSYHIFIKHLITFLPNIGGSTTNASERFQRSQ